MLTKAMLPTYKAILRGNYLEWRGNVSEHVPLDRAVAVYVTILDEPVIDTAVGNQGQRMAAALEQLAEMHALPDIGDPLVWEREMRRDRELPGREI